MDPNPPLSLTVNKVRGSYFCILLIAHDKISNWVIWSYLLINKSSFASFCKITWISPWWSGSITSPQTQSPFKAKQRHYFAKKCPSSQGYGFSSSHVWMRELDYKESWVPKNWFFWTAVLEKTFESPLDCKEIQPVYSKGDQSWVFFGRNDAKTETPVLWPPHELTHWKRLWYWQRLRAGGIGGDRGWMAILTQSGSCWWTGRPGVLRFMGSQRVGHDWMAELNWTDSDKCEVLSHFGCDFHFPDV